MQKTMKGNENKLAIALALIGVVVGLIGMWAFYNNNYLVLEICGGACAVILFTRVLSKQVQIHVIPYLFACIAYSWVVIQNLILFVPYSLCLYSATGIIYVLVLMMVPQNLFSIIVGIIGIIVYYLNLDQWFLVCGTFCLTDFITACVCGKILGSAYRLWFGLFVIGWVGANSISLLPNLPHVERIITGLVWGSCAFYPVSIVYLWIRVYILKEDLTKSGSLD